jgi:hypothetical protein
MTGLQSGLDARRGKTSERPPKDSSTRLSLERDCLTSSTLSLSMLVIHRLWIVTPYDAL